MAQLKNLIVNGVARIVGKVFASEFVGNLSWSNITGKPSTYTPSDHTHSQYITNGGTNPTCGNGQAITQPGGAAVLSIRTTDGGSRDAGILYLSQDNAYIANSSDNGYTFGVFDTDLTQDMSSGDNASFVVLSNGAGCKSKGTITASSFSGSFSGSLSGNATTASSAGFVTSNSQLTYGASGLNYWNQSTSVTSGAKSNANPTNDWYHIIRMNHGNSAGYFVDLAICFHSYNMSYRRVQAGNEYGWVRVLDSNCYSSYSSFSGQVTGSSFKATSDRNLKENIEEVNPVDLSQITAYRYNLKNDKSDSSKHIGLIAQEVQKIIPEAVSKVDDHLVLDYNAVLSMLISSYNQKIKQLESRIDSLEKQSQQLNS